MFPPEIKYYIFSYLSYSLVSKLSIYFPQHTLLNSNVFVLCTKYYTDRFFNAYSNRCTLSEEDADFIFRYYIVRCQFFRFPVLIWTLENDANIHYNNDMAVGYAARCGYLKIIKKLIDYGADVRADDDYAFRTAAENNCLNVVKYLKDTFDVNIEADDNSAIKEASFNGHAEMVLYLIENGANVNAERGMALINAANSNHLDVVKLLIKHGASVKEDDSEALKIASRCGNFEVVKFLFELDPTIDDSDKEEACEQAAWNGHINIVKFFIENKVKIDKYQIKYAAESGYLDVVEYLIRPEIGCSKNDALLGACQGGHLPIVKMLLNNGADVHYGEDEAIIEASDKGNVDVVRYLIKKGANFHVNCEQPLYNATIEGHLNVVKCLVEAGANFRADNNAAMYYALKNNRSDILEYLKQAEKEYPELKMPYY